MNKNPLFSIVIPCYNEQKYIRDTIHGIAAAFADEEYEIIVVNDGSTDNSADVLASLRLDQPAIRVLTHDRNQGKGAAIRTGILSATGQIIAFIDGDHEIDPTYIKPMISLMRESDYVDAVIGNRYLVPGMYKTTVIRRIYSKTYQLMNIFLFSLSYRDTQAGLKIFRNATAKKLFQESKVNGFAFDIEILVYASLSGLHIEEYPIAQSYKGTTTIAKKHIIRMLIDTCDVYFEYRKQKWAQLAAGDSSWQRIAIFMCSNCLTSIIAGLLSITAKTIERFFVRPR